MKIEDLSKNYEEVLGVPFAITYLNPNVILNDHTHYQRYLIGYKVLELLDRPHHEFENHNGNIVGKRQDGYYFAVNGQHHSVAAALKGVSLCRYYVFESKGWEHEKQIFDKIQVMQGNK